MKAGDAVPMPVWTKSLEKQSCLKVTGSVVTEQDVGAVVFCFDS